MSSVEAGGDRWPPSPAIQQLSRQRTSHGSEFLVGVGMAGTSHWSLSAETSSGAAALQLDIACRVKEPPSWLGSTYCLATGFQAIQQGSAIVLASADVPGQVKLELMDIHGPRLDSQGQICRLAADCEGPYPRTVRWKYRILICA